MLNSESTVDIISNNINNSLDESSIGPHSSPQPACRHGNSSSSSSTVRVSRRRPRAQTRVHGSTLSFHSVNYSVTVPAPGLKCCSTTDKQILFDATGIFRPGMNAIMGPSGSGKTTLLDVLAGRCEEQGIDGHILIDGHRRPKNFRLMTGYVVQDDVVMGTLTVRENLMFSANLRLPSTVSHAEKCQRVTETIEELGLDKCADSKVGTEFIRGVSGGERKRTNIGMELIISPPILFLDEPTSGLDATTSGAVMALLSRLSVRGRTIIFSIHQPRYAIFKLFDRLMLVAAGRTVFHGQASDALDFFQSIGYECDIYDNPPDFFLDVVNGDSRAVTCNTDASDANKLAEMQDGESIVTSEAVTVNMQDDVIVDDEQRMNKSRSLAVQLSTKFKESIHYQRCADECKAILGEWTQRAQTGTETIIPRVQYMTSFTDQMRHVANRTFINLLRSPQVSILQTGTMVVLGIVIGVIFLNLDFNSAGIQNRQGLLFFVSIGAIMINLPAIEVFLKERIIFVHESASGFYRVSAYFVSKVLCDVIPMRVIPIIAHCLIVYFMTGLQVEAGKFFLFLFTLFLVTMCASGIAFAFSATIKVFTVANLSCVLVFVLMIIFGGLLANIGTLRVWIRWLQYLSVVRYSYNILMINEFAELHFPVDNIPGAVTYGSDILNMQAVRHSTTWDKWQNIMALVLIATAAMTTAYIQLRRMKKLK